MLPHIPLQGEDADPGRLAGLLAEDRFVGVQLPATDLLLVVSGRVSFEIVQKALAAGVAGIVAVSAPSSLAVDLAVDRGMTLVGFLRGPRMNVYAGHDRVEQGSTTGGR